MPCLGRLHLQAAHVQACGFRDGAECFGGSSGLVQACQVNVCPRGCCRAKGQPLPACWQKLSCDAADHCNEAAGCDTPLSLDNCQPAVLQVGSGSVTELAYVAEDTEDDEDVRTPHSPRSSPSRRMCANVSSVSSQCCSCSLTRVEPSNPSYW